MKRIVSWSVVLLVAIALGAACAKHTKAGAAAGLPRGAGTAPMYGGGDAYGGMGYAYGNGKGW